jgi:hypothetical protein
MRQINIKETNDVKTVKIVLKNEYGEYLLLLSDGQVDYLVKKLRVKQLNFKTPEDFKEILDPRPVNTGDPKFLLNIGRGN